MTIDLERRESDSEGNAALSALRAELRQLLQPIRRNRLAPLAAKEGFGFGGVNIELKSGVAQEIGAAQPRFPAPGLPEEALDDARFHIDVVLLQVRNLGLD